MEHQNLNENMAIKVAKILYGMTEIENEDLEEEEGDDKMFMAVTKIEDKAKYVELFLRIVRLLDLEACVIIHVLMLIDEFMFSKIKILTKNTLMLVTVTAISLSYKFNYDDIISGYKLATSVFQLKENELIDMEIEFLKGIDYKLLYTKEEFQVFINEVSLYE